MTRWRRWLGDRIVVLVAWALRRGVTQLQVTEALAKSFPHRDAGWRYDVLADATARNIRRERRTHA